MFLTMVLVLCFVTAYTVFTWLNTAATISYVLKLDATTIQDITLKQLECGYYSVIIIRAVQ